MRRSKSQEGVVLLIALITLLAMTLAGIGIMRSIDTGTMVAGNIGFRQSAVMSGDKGIEAGRKWLMDNQTALNADNPTYGYYSTRQDSLDLTGNRTEGGLDGVDWGGSDPSQPTKAVTVASDGSGNAIFYIVHRMCSIPGSVNAMGQSCATVTASAIGSSQDAPDYSTYGLQIRNQVYYRITSRIAGPKNTVSFVQAVVVM